MNLRAVTSRVKVPLFWNGRSPDELKNLQRELIDVSRQEKVKIFWQADLSWRNFREHPSGETIAAGSSQPDPDEFRRLFSGSDIGFDVDLREEPHGFVRVPTSFSPDGWLGISRTNVSNWPEPGIKAKRLNKLEQELLQHKIKKGKMVVYHISRDGKARKEKIDAGETQSERQVVEQIARERAAAGQQPVEYCRIPITDEMPPTPKAVDQLVAVRNRAAAEGKGIYYHCSHGRGRTTTAMVLDDIMNGKTVDEALAENARAPGKDLKTIDARKATNPLRVKGTALRLGLIHRFAEYWNSPDRKSTTFRRYMKEHPIDASYESRMMTLISFVDNSANT